MGLYESIPPRRLGSYIENAKKVVRQVAPLAIRAEIEQQAGLVNQLISEVEKVHRMDARGLLFANDFQRYLGVRAALEASAQSLGSASALHFEDVETELRTNRRDSL